MKGFRHKHRMASHCSFWGACAVEVVTLSWNDTRSWVLMPNTLCAPSRWRVLGGVRLSTGSCGGVSGEVKFVHRHVLCKLSKPGTEDDVPQPGDRWRCRCVKAAFSPHGM
jgi:hypothetical protein